MKEKLIVGTLVCLLFVTFGVLAIAGDLSKVPAEAATSKIKEVVNANVDILNANSLVTGALAVEVGGATSGTNTTITQSFTTAFVSAPALLFTVDGLTVTNSTTVSSNQFVVVMGSTNVTYKYLAVGATE